MQEFRKRYWYQIALCASYLPLLYSPIAYTAEMDGDIIEASAFPSVNVDKDTYTVNFNNVSAIELIRFASKITHLNFVFEEPDLAFSVTLVSEEAVTAKSVMAALSQVLRTHGLVLLEQDGNVLITKSTSVNQIPPIISSDLPNSRAGNAALVTQVFRIKNANINTLVTVIRPMTSLGAFVEISAETRQLIVTDITTNVEQIGNLIESLDAAHSPLDVDTYSAKNISPGDLVTLTKQILAPFTEGNPLNFIPQIDTNSIYIVSTPYLIEKAMTLMEDLDIPTKPMLPTRMGDQTKSTFLVYQPLYRPGVELAIEMGDLEKNLAQAGLANPPLLETLASMRWIASANSLIFTGDPQSIERIRGMLSSVDSPTAYLKSSQVFVYKPLNTSQDQILSALSDLLPSLKETDTLSDNNLVDAITSMQWNADTQSFLVTSDAATIDRLKSLLTSIDTAQSPLNAQSKNFFLYKLQFVRCDALVVELNNIAKKLPQSSLQNQNLLAAVEKIECIPSNNSLLISGSSDAIEQIKSLVAEFDVDTSSGLSAGAPTFLIYRPKFLPAEQIQSALVDLKGELESSGLNDPVLFQVLSTMRYVPLTDSLLFTGSQEGLDKVQHLINDVDTTATLNAIHRIGNVTFFLYKVQSTNTEKLIASLKSFAADLQQSDTEDKQLAETISHVKWIKETNSLLFTGRTEVLEKVEQLVKKFDLPSSTATHPERAAETFVIYNPRYIHGDELIAILCEFMDNLMASGVADPGLFDTISNLKWIEKTSSLLISGDQLSVDKVQQLVTKFDSPSKTGSVPSIESIDNTSFLVYKLQYHPGNDIRNALQKVAASLAKGGSSPPALVDAIHSLQWIEVTNSLLCSGQQDVLVKLKDLIQNLDIPLRQVFIEILVIQTSLNNQQNFGMQWGGQLKYFNKTVLQTGNFPLANPPSSLPTTSATFPPNLQGINATTTPTGSSIPFSTGFDLGVIGDIIMHKGRSFLSLGSLMNALQLDSDSTVVLNPKIITQDNRQSTVFVGQNVPYTGALVTNSSNSTVSNANIEYRDVGVSLTITPILGDGDMITMDIVQDISQLLNNTNVTTSNQQLTGIQTSHAHMETRVHVPNNHFVALSGMINDNKTHYRTSIPCLGGLPVIGAIFSENDRQDQKGNIIIFVRPQIVKDPAVYKAITEHQEWLYKDQARLPVLKEEFDDGLDMVKLPENE
jgi:type II secretory pathway component GspD/PulD (secretin)